MTMTITLTDEDLLRLRMIEIDRDANDALEFVLERILYQVQLQQKQQMKNHLDGGKGSLF